jgi:hypothetical protein
MIRKKSLVISLEGATEKSFSEEKEELNIVFINFYIR